MFKKRSIIGLIIIRYVGLAILTMTLSSCSLGLSASTSPYSEAPSSTKISSDLQDLGSKNPLQKCEKAPIGAWSKAPLFKGIMGQLIDIFPVSGMAGQKSFLIVTKNGQVLFKETSNARVRILMEIPDSLTAAAINCQAELLALAPTGGARIYRFSEISQSKPTFTQASLPHSNLRRLVFDVSGHSLFCASEDLKIYRWRLDHASNKDREVERYAGSTGVTNALVVHPAGDFFMTGDWRGGLFAWRTYDADAFNGKYDISVLGARIFQSQAEVVNSGRHGASIEELLLANSLKYLYAGTYDGKVELWRVRGFIKVGEISLYRGLIQSMDQSPSGNRLATLSRDGQLRILDLVETPQPHFELRVERSVTGGSLIRFVDESRLIVVSRDGVFNDISF